MLVNISTYIYTGIYLIDICTYITFAEIPLVSLVSANIWDGLFVFYVSVCMGVYDPIMSNVLVILIMVLQKRGK